MFFSSSLWLCWSGCGRQCGSAMSDSASHSIRRNCVVLDWCFFFSQSLPVYGYKGAFGVVSFLLARTSSVQANDVGGVSAM